MQLCEDSCIAALDFEANTDVSAASLKMPKGENSRGFCEDGAELPKNAYRICPACLMKSTHHPPGHEEVKEERQQIKKDWKKDMATRIICRRVTLISNNLLWQHRQA